MNNNNLAIAAAPNALATTSTGAIAASREVTEAAMQMQLARLYPRDEQASIDRILNACTRNSLAEQAVYVYTRGGVEVSGPSIRLAECIAQNWGNMNAGVRELEQTEGGSMCEAFAIDYQTNVRISKTFYVPHTRYTKTKGNYRLTDPRDIYELVANNGARRLRACILSIVPGDVVEQAVRQCEVTIEAKADTTPDGIRKLIKAFEAIGVTQTQIEKFIQRRAESITASQVLRLRKVYASIKDGMSKAADWFPAEAATAENATNAEMAENASRIALQRMGKGKTPKEAAPPLKTQNNAVSGDSEETEAAEVAETEAETPETPSEDEEMPW